MFRFSKRSERNLEGVHPELVRLVRATLEVSPIDFGITEGVRSVERQRALIKAGASWTPNSRHITGHAVDIACWLDVDGDGRPELRWDYGLYEQVAKAFKKQSILLGIPITWGGDWGSRDGVHYQLSWDLYPAKEYIA